MAHKFTFDCWLYPEFPRRTRTDLTRNLLYAASTHCKVSLCATWNLKLDENSSFVCDWRRNCLRLKMEAWVLGPSTTLLRSWELCHRFYSLQRSQIFKIELRRTWSVVFFCHSAPARFHFLSSPDWFAHIYLVLIISFAGVNNAKWVKDRIIECIDKLRLLRLSPKIHALWGLMFYVVAELSCTSHINSAILYFASIVSWLIWALRYLIMFMMLSR